jgi:hypothetical protein
MQYVADRYHGAHLRFKERRQIATAKDDTLDINHIIREAK